MTATELANLFVSTAKEESQRVGYRKGIQYGSGTIPYDKGGLQDSIRVTGTGENHAQVTIGSGDIFYAEFLEFAQRLRNGAPNRHNGFIERFCMEAFAQKIAARYGCEVTVTMEERK